MRAPEPVTVFSSVSSALAASLRLLLFSLPKLHVKCHPFLLHLSLQTVEEYAGSKVLCLSLVITNIGAGTVM